MRQIARLSIQIIGIYAFIRAIPMIGPLVNALVIATDPRMRIAFIAGTLIPLLLLVLIGFYLLVNAGKLSEMLVPGEGEVELNIPIKPVELQALAFSIIGVVLIVLAVPRLYWLGSNIYALRASADYRLAVPPNLARDTISMGVTILIQIILGVLLFVSGHSLANLWQALMRRIQDEKEMN